MKKNPPTTKISKENSRISQNEVRKMVPRGYGGYEIDNTLAYAEVEETPEEREARKDLAFENKLEAEANAGEIRRTKLKDLVEFQQDTVQHNAEEVAEDDLEFIHGEMNYEKLIRQQCCAGNYVDPVLNTGKGRSSFIIRALFPVMLTYAVAAVYALFMTFSSIVRVLFYTISPYYAIASACCWVSVNIAGRVTRKRKYLIPLFVVRAVVVSNFLAAIQIYSEFYVWEVLFTDPTELNSEVTMKMQARLVKDNHFQESWLNLPKDMHVNDFNRRSHFTHAYFGALLATSFFSAIACVIIGLKIRSKRENLTPQDVTSKWMQRTAGIASLIPAFILFFTNNYLFFLSPPRSTNFLQILPIGILALGFGVLVTTVWTPLLSGDTCFHVNKEDALFFGFMFSF